MRVVVTGVCGQLGGELCRQLGSMAIGLDVDALDLRHTSRIADTLLRLRPELVINCAAYTQVDRAESEPEVCRAVNAIAVERMAAACGKLDCPLVQISTDYVFGAAPPQPRPWREEDIPSPQGVYARSKLAGEQAAARHPKHIIVRTCGLYARPSDPRAKNFVKTMLRLGGERAEVRVVADQYCTPTYVPNLARAVLWLAGAANGQPAPWGVYHVTDGGQTAWCEFAQDVFRLAKMEVKVCPITTADYAAAAARPAYSVLDTGRYHRLGGPPMPDWRSSLKKYIAQWRN